MTRTSQMSYQKSKSKQENSLTSSSYYGSLGSDEIALDIFKTQPESSGIKVIETYITTEVKKERKFVSKIQNSFSFLSIIFQK